MNRPAKFSVITALVVALSVIFSGLALADQAQLDNDTATNGVQNTRSFTVDPSDPISTSGQALINWSGSKHLVAGSTISLTLDTAATTLPAGYTAANMTGSVPATWSNNTHSFTLSSAVSFTAPSDPGDYSYAVKWNPTTFSCASSGCLNSGDAITMTINVTVNEPVDPCLAVTAPATPTITSVPAAANGLADWFTTVPTVSASSTTAGATISYATDGATFGPSAPVIGEGLTTVTAKATSATCNKTSTAARDFKVDTVAPVIALDGVDDDVAITTWTNAASVSRTFDVSDPTPGSGLPDGTPATTTITVTDESTLDVDNNVVPSSSSATIADIAGNSTTRTVSALIDRTAPASVTFGAFDAVQIVGGVAAAPSCTATDPLSGLASCIVTGYSTELGSHTLTATATDNVGNQSTATFAYVVRANVSGFAAPVDRAPYVNKANAGKSVPLKWRMTDANGNPVQLSTAQLLVVKPKAISLTCAGLGTTDDIESYSTNTLGARYMGDGWYHYDWKSPTTYASSCKTVTMDGIPGGVGSGATADFRFVR